MGKTGLTDKENEYSKRIPITYKRLWGNVRKKSAAPRLAIKAQCQQCVGYENVRTSIKDCDSTACPLFAYRPYQDNSDQDSINETEQEQEP
jgi:hypothetical protein